MEQRADLLLNLSFLGITGINRPVARHPYILVDFAWPDFLSISLRISTVAIYRVFFALAGMAA
jgi:hypothetical protein